MQSRTSALLRGLAGITLLATALSTSALATPASYSSNLAFSTGTQSIWGPGQGTSSFGTSGSASVPSTFFTPEVGVGYDFSASSGTASANVSGALSASYDDYLLAPGVASIGVSFGPTSGNFSTNLGARANLTGFVHDIPFAGPWDFCFYCKNWALSTSSSSAPGFGVTRSDTDVISVAGVGPSFGSLASAQLSLNATQRSNLRLDDFNGLLTWEHVESGTTGMTPFSTAGTSVLGVMLDQEGTWNFGFADLDLANTFWSTMGASLSFDINVFGVINESWPFSGLNLLNTGGFDLDFAKKNVATAFSITVPEPGTGLLMTIGLSGLGVFGRRTKRFSLR